MSSIWNSTRKKYVNYLEILIEKDGHILYAVPSHQEKAIALACEKQCVTRRELLDMCPKNRYYDFIDWLLEQTGAIAVWTKHCVAPSATRKQVAALRRLKMAGVYKGAIPLMTEGNEERING